jgi:hypothetical protein
MCTKRVTEWGSRTANRTKCEHEEGRQERSIERNPVLSTAPPRPCFVVTLARFPPRNWKTHCMFRLSDKFKPLPFRNHKTQAHRRNLCLLCASCCKIRQICTRKEASHGNDVIVVLNPLKPNWGGGGKSILLEGTQVIPARPSDKDRMGMKTLGWWVVNAWDREGRNWFHDSLLSVEII